MRLLDRLIQGTGVVCRGGVLLCGALVVLISIVIAFDVVARKATGISIVGVDEISGFILAISCSWGCAFALLHRAHVRVETVQLVLSQRICAILDLVGLLLLGAFVAIVGWYGANVLNMSIDMGSNADMLDVSLWIPQTAWVAGYLMFVIVAVLLFLRSAAALLAGDLTTLHALIGSRSAVEEVEHEKQQVVAHREDTR
ncbi:MAG: TRAP transporter small permease [Rhodospirillales bacterium]|jgi:TRAP-type C4-dicarboxylate transport system permease small subunit|nr:TRAP transporter small permease [Rhodospirillales bacterium]